MSFSLQVCRFCMLSENVSINLNASDTECKQIHEKISFVIPEILENDKNLPQRICISCHTDLSVAYRFKKKCLASHKRLIYQLDQPQIQSNIKNSELNAVLKQETISNDTITNSASTDINFITIKTENVISDTFNDPSEYVVKEEDVFESGFEYVNVSASTVTNIAHNQKNDTSLAQNVNNIEYDKKLYENTSALNKPNVHIENNVKIGDPLNFSNILYNQTIPSVNSEKEMYSSTSSFLNRDNFDEQLETDRTEFIFSNPANPNEKFGYVKDVRNQIFSCKTCDKQFTDMFSLSDHLYLHANYKKYKCNTCNFTTHDRINLINHKRLRLCSIYNLLNPQVKNDNNNENIMNTELNDSNNEETFNPEIKLSNSEDNNKMFECETCNKQFESMAYLKEHIYVHKKYKCEECDFTSYKIGAMKYHKLSHGDGSFICQVCSKEFKSLSSLENHKKTHLNTNKFICEVCGLQCKSKRWLEQHFRMKHGDLRNEKYECEFCHKFYKSKCSLMGHVRIHDESNFRFKCTVCGRMFLDKSKMDVHMRIHSDEFPYKCKYCSKAFRQSGYYHVHLRKHTGERPHTCEVCFKGFIKLGELREHMFQHTGEKTYQCVHCQKKFIRAKSCYEHRKRCKAKKTI